ncbi:electron transfer flavoprotein subunit alpha [Salmonella enterica subsp. enterica]|uniref:Electron transfer flavoprotein subunit alpha n=1 Tax=Salmonella enterica I TaxID=59201 RepID=A0A379WVJ8_SALET|nr:electron transfer flavoprotein subunit alpha [Salmonella enterica subsp. enterica]
MERERYIGVSGVLLKSDLYLTLGISGQIQHMVGGNGAKIIVAINKDKNAPIFNYADYGLVGDIYKVVPALIDQLKPLIPFSTHISRRRYGGKGA